MAALSAMGVDVYTKQTKTVPSFVMRFTHPKQDVDVSGQMHVNGHIGIGLTQVSRLPTVRCGWHGSLPQNWSVSIEKSRHCHTLCLNLKVEQDSKESKKRWLM